MPLILSAALLLSACSTSEPLQQGTADAPKQTMETEGSRTTSKDAEPVQDAENTPATESAKNTDASPATAEPAQTADNLPEDKLPAYGAYYYDLTNVVLYIEVYGELPPNYITKAQARELGWEGGSVENYKEGAAIGGDHFGNFEGLLPDASGRSYTECDIDTNGYSSRGSRRLVFSNDGLYFYTSDHYESFSQVTVTEDYEVIR